MLGCVAQALKVFNLFGHSNFGKLGWYGGATIKLGLCWYINHLLYLLVNSDSHGKSPFSHLFTRYIHSKWAIFHSYVKLPEGKQSNAIATNHRNVRTIKKNNLVTLFGLLKICVSVAPRPSRCRLHATQVGVETQAGHRKHGSNMGIHMGLYEITWDDLGDNGGY